MSQPPYQQQPGQYPQAYPPYAQHGSPLGLGYEHRPMGPTPKSYLVESILVTIFCCMPFGIVAIVYAAMAKGALDQGNWHQGASYSNTARTWMLVSLFCGLAPILIWLAVVILAAVTA